MVNQVTNHLEDHNPNRIQSSSNFTQLNESHNQIQADSAYSVNIYPSHPTSYNNPSYTNTSFQSGSYNQSVNSTFYPTYYPNEYNQNQTQSTDSEQYLINNYYESPDQVAHHSQEDQEFIGNYHHSNHNGNQISANNHQYIYENYYTEYLANFDNGLNLNSMIILNPSLLERLKSLCSKNLFCFLLIILIPIFATILILICIKLINNTDKTDKDDLHQYAIYSFVIFAAFFLLPFALLVVLIEIKKCFPNFISNDELTLDSNLLANNLVPPQLTTHATLTANQPLVSRTLVNNQIDLQANLQVVLPNELSSRLSNNNLAIIQNNNLTTTNSPDNQQMSTLNVNQLENNRQLINDMLEEFDQMNHIDQERTLQRMSAIQRRKRLSRQNAFASVNECSTIEQQQTNEFIYYSEDKPPSYELALLCPKRDTITDQKLTTKNNNTNIKDDKKLQTVSSASKSITVVNLTDVNQTCTTGHLNNNLTNEMNNTLQTELRNNLENRRRSSNTEPPSYDKLFREDL